MPRWAALLQGTGQFWSLEGEGSNKSLPDCGAILGEGSQLLLDTEHTVHAVNEQDKDEDKCNLRFRLDKENPEPQASRLPYLQAVL